MARPASNTTCSIKDCGKPTRSSGLCQKHYSRSHYLKNKPHVLAASKTWQQENQERYRARLKRWREANPEKVKAGFDRWYARPEKAKGVIQRAAEWVKANPVRRKEIRSKWKKGNRGKVQADGVARIAKKLRATPAWADLKAIAEFYRNCPRGYHVDHVIPLRSRKVCGLHVLENLQYLPAMDNFRKSNTFDSDR